MTEIRLKSNDNMSLAIGEDEGARDVEFPLPPKDIEGQAFQMEIYARFMRHFRMVPNNDVAIKILSAIQFTADMMDLRDELVAKTLVDLGLRAPRRAFPQAYLAYIDTSLLRNGFDIGGPDDSMRGLKIFWDDLREDKFASVRNHTKFEQTSITL